MTDETRNSLDGGGVDRTSLFENSVATFIALGGLFQTYDVGIGPRYLKHFETFVLDHNVRPVDCIAQHLIVLHSANGRPDRAERVVWDNDTPCLDIDRVPV